MRRYIVRYHYDEHKKHEYGDNKNLYTDADADRHGGQLW
jgi:hypothetical protein